MARSVLVVTTCAILLAACSLGIDQKKFEAVHRATRAIEAAISLGVTSEKFGELLRGLATEIAIASDKVTTEREKRLMAVYSAVLLIYRDSAKIWEVKSRDAWAPEAQILFNSSELMGVAEKYNLPKTAYGSSGTLASIPGDSVQRIWRIAAAKAEEANAELHGRSR